MPSKFQNDAIFWVEVDKIKPNPYQPRRDFNEQRLRDLAESIRQYGVLQPLTVTRKEQVKDDGGLKVEYELIAGERRHRASQMANLSQVPVIIRSGKEDSQVKLELAIIENLQREDLNPIERAEAFDQLANEFDFTHKKIAQKIGKSREYVSNSMRLLKLPEKIKQAIISGKMTEGHARPIMMLRDKPEQQEMLFKEVVHKGLTVREAESIARRDAQDKVRKKKNKIDPETKALEDRLSDTFGTRVKIEERDVGGKLVIDFFSEEDLENIIKLVQAGGDVEMGDMMEEYVQSVADDIAESDESSNKDMDDTQSDSKDSSGTSMAETLGTMIAAARKKQEAQDEGAEDNDGAESVEDNHKSFESEEAPANQSSVGYDEGNDQQTDHQIQADEPAREKENNFSDIATDSDSPDETHAPEPEPSVDTETNYDLETSEPEDDIEENDTEEMNTDEDQEAPEESEEDEMYSVSNFSI